MKNTETFEELVKEVEKLYPKILNGNRQYSFRFYDFRENEYEILKTSEGVLYIDIWVEGQSFTLVNSWDANKILKVIKAIKQCEEQ